MDYSSDQNNNSEFEADFKKKDLEPNIQELNQKDACIMYHQDKPRISFIVQYKN